MTYIYKIHNPYMLDDSIVNLIWWLMSNNLFYDDSIKQVTDCEVLRAIYLCIQFISSRPPHLQ